MFLHDVVDDLEVLFRRRDQPADALNRLSDERCNLARSGRPDVVFHVAGALDVTGRIGKTERAAITVSIHRVREPGRRSAAAQPPGADPGCRHRRRGPPMITMPQGDNLMRAGIESRGQERGFVGFGPGIGEVRLCQRAARRLFGDRLRQQRLRLGDIRRGDVFQRIHLLFHLLVHGIVAVPNADGNDPPEKVQILVAIRVPDELVLGLCDNHRLAEIMKHGREDMILMDKNEFLLVHVDSGDDGFEMPAKAAGRKLEVTTNDSPNRRSSSVGGRGSGLDSCAGLRGQPTGYHFPPGGRAGRCNARRVAEICAHPPPEQSSGGLSHSLSTGFAPYGSK